MAASFVKALGTQWVATLYAAAVAVGLSFALGRVLGPADFGVYSYVLTLGSLFVIIQDGGFSTLLFRETAKAGTDFAQGAPPLCSMALGHLVFTTMLGCVLVLLLPIGEKAATFFAVLYYAFFSLASFISSRLKGENHFTSEAMWRAICRTATAAAIGLVLILPNPTAAKIFLAILFGQALPLLLPQSRPIRVRPRLSFHKGVYAACGAFLLINAATTIYFRCDIILLKNLVADPAEVGNYAAAYRFIEGVVLLATPLAHIFFRKLRVSLDHPEDFRRSFLRMLCVMIFLGAAALVGGLLFGPFVLILAFGEKFRPALPLLSWLLASLPFILPNYILTQGLVAINRERYYAGATILAAALNISLNLWLIPSMGAKGAALATVITEGFLCATLGASFIFKGFGTKQPAGNGR